jgi:hypothetical protein
LGSAEHKSEATGLQTITGPLRKQRDLPEFTELAGRRRILAGGEIEPPARGLSERVADERICHARVPLPLVGLTVGPDVFLADFSSRSAYI